MARRASHTPACDARSTPARAAVGDRVKRKGVLGGRTLGLALGLMALTGALPMIIIALLTSGGSDPQPPPDAATVRAAQDAADFPLYWAGESVAGLPLTGVTRDGGAGHRPVRHLHAVRRRGRLPAAGADPDDLDLRAQPAHPRPAAALELARARRAGPRLRRRYLSLEIGTSNVTLFTRPEYRQPVRRRPARGARPGAHRRDGAAAAALSARLRARAAPRARHLPALRQPARGARPARHLAVRRAPAARLRARARRQRLRRPGDSSCPRRGARSSRRLTGRLTLRGLAEGPEGEQGHRDEEEKP